MKTPVLFIIFNRPEVTKRVFTEIKKQKPEFLFVAADGPRKNEPGEELLCSQCRSNVLDEIDWDCKVQTSFHPENLGCGKAVSSAIDWFFEHVEEGIILEDDCLPDETFFPFCTQLLGHYRNDESIMHISGNNFQLGQRRGDGSYYFSRYTHVWGWATWKRAWRNYDFSMARYKQSSLTGLSGRLRNDFNNISNKHIDTWDYQWFFAIWFNNGKVINPQVNLVRNIGFGVKATHTHKLPSWVTKMEYGSVNVIIHPSNTDVNADADTYEDIILKENLVLVVLKKIYRLLFKSI